MRPFRFNERRNLAWLPGTVHIVTKSAIALKLLPTSSQIGAAWRKRLIILDLLVRNERLINVRIKPGSVSIEVNHSQYKRTNRATNNQIGTGALKVLGSVPGDWFESVFKGVELTGGLLRQPTLVASFDT